jgi:Flp pilus assembly protein TadG
VLGPGLLAILGLVIVAGRISAASSAVEQAAAAAARTASIARDARSASAQAQRAALRSLQDQGVTCQALSASVDTSGFAVAVGMPASVSVTVRCSLPLSDVAVPGLPGTRVVTADMASPLDRYRGRS